MFAGLMLGNAIAYVYHMLMARMLLPADYGVLVTLLSISYVLAVLMRTFQAWVIKAVAVPGGSNASLIQAVFIGALRTLVPLGLLAFVAHWLVSGLVSDFLHLGSATPVIVLGLYTLSSFIVPISRGMLLGLDRLRFAGLIYILEPTARIVAGIVLVGMGFGVSGALIGFSLGNGLAFVVALIPLWALLFCRAEPSPPANTPRGLDRYTLLVLAINTCLALMIGIDQIAVKHYFSEEVAGNYAVAFLLGQIITMSTISLGWVVFARSATLAPDDPRHAHLLLRGLLVIGLIAVTLTIGYFTAPELAIRLMGGSQYTIAHTYVGLVGIEATLFAFIYLQAYYQISVKQTKVIWPLCIAVVVQVALLLRYHATVTQVLVCIISVLSGLLICVSLLSWWILREQRSAPMMIQPASEAVADIG
jgi:O-antigen/teichoic acid export membrane protein